MYEISFHLNQNLQAVKALQSVHMLMPGPIGLLIVSLAADPGVASSIPAQSQTFIEIDHEIMVILLLPLIQEGLLSVTSKSMCTKYWLTA